MRRVVFTSQGIFINLIEDFYDLIWNVKDKKTFILLQDGGGGGHPALLLYKYVFFTKNKKIQITNQLKLKIEKIQAGL